MNTGRVKGRLRRIGYLACAAITAAFFVAPEVAGQDYRDVRKPDAPLVLSARGSFYVGGSVVERTSSDLQFPADSMTINQMYVEYMIKQGATKVPVILVHGSSLSGKTYDTTPDGRMGWYEYFTRKDHPAYVVDQVGRARSGFDQSVFNQVRDGTLKPSQMPPMRRLGDRVSGWQNFRFGPRFGTAYPGTKFPLNAVGALSKQAVPDLTAAQADPNPTPARLAELADTVGGAVVLGHSQGGRFPLEAIRADQHHSVKGAILVEPGPMCGGGNAKLGWVYDDEQIKTLAKVPILIVYGDHLATDTGIPGRTLLWKDAYDDCVTFVDRVTKAGGNARIVNLADVHMPGHTHMMMQDLGNLQIADFLLAWLDRNLPGTAGRPRRP